jgi:hypothetical protein
MKNLLIFFHKSCITNSSSFLLYDRARGNVGMSDMQELWGSVGLYGSITPFSSMSC